MSDEKKRKIEALMVDGDLYKQVLDRAKVRQAGLIGLRDIVQADGLDLRPIVARAGEIERMVRDYRELLGQHRVAGAEQQANDFEAILVEFKLRMEQGTLRTGRKTAGGKPGSASVTNKVGTEARQRIDENGQSAEDDRDVQGADHKSVDNQDDEGSSGDGEANGDLDDDVTDRDVVDRVSTSAHGADGGRSLVPDGDRQFLSQGPGSPASVPEDELDGQPDEHSTQRSRGSDGHER
ncbi:MAG: hypothetical protein GY873_13680 [Bosea sp.]|uniref:hypothetical protein n=1 Tax=Bosea sp. (in: a-proteobacteria) TaxID=1871050 RepID=UPI002394D143|nr:hypothetical protein [Bosea sp. (in: a-proteobacteria)]MCP4735230.1 hypothetical protein [Bosea sp. (in: a-proteobacteria)]